MSYVGFLLIHSCNHFFKSLFLPPFQVVERFIPPLLEAVLGDYQRSIPASRDAEVLATMATIVEKLKDNITPQVLPIFAAVFESTLEMINRVSVYVVCVCVCVCVCACLLEINQHAGASRSAPSAVSV